MDDSAKKPRRELEGLLACAPAAMRVSERHEFDRLSAGRDIVLMGAGGLGQMLYMSLSLFQQSQAMTIILAMLMLVALVDAASAWLRQRLAQ